MFLKFVTTSHISFLHHNHNNNRVNQNLGEPYIMAKFACPVKCAVSCVRLLTVDEGHVGLEECDNSLDGLQLIVLDGTQVNLLPSDSVTWKHLVQEGGTKLQRLVLGLGLKEHLQYTGSLLKNEPQRT